MRRATVLLALSLSLPAVPASVATAQQPPQELRLEGDHWTAWDPPDTFPEGAEIYVIERGDTLWDLGERFLGDPYLWPQIWERNAYILDAHWIYPGDPLVVGLEVTPIEELAETGLEAAPEEPEDRLGLEGRPTPPVPLGIASDIYCSGFISSEEQSFPYTIVGSEYQALAPSLYARDRRFISGTYGTADSVKYNLTTGDIVYLDGGRATGLTPGALFTAVWPERRVQHPVRGGAVGHLYRYLGKVRVLSVQDDTAIAEIVESCDPIKVGAVLKPFKAEPIPLGRRTPMRPPSNPPPPSALEDSGVVLLSGVPVGGTDSYISGLVTLAEDHVVFIDRGARHDVTPGDFFTIYRMNQPGLPPVVVGELAVLSVHETTSVARILESRYAVHVGDRLSRK